MVAKQNWTKLNTIITPLTDAPHFFLVAINIKPKTQCQKLHNKKLPSCPSQKQLNKY